MKSALSELVVPIHADSFFSVGRHGEIHERLSFEYSDPEGYYRMIIKDDDLFRKEVEKLVANMQYFLDQERVHINDERVRSHVSYCDIFLKGHSEVVSVIYLIDFSGKFTHGINRIETWLEEEDAPYDFEIIWRFPIGTKVTEVYTVMEHEVYDDILTLWAFEGEAVGGYERLQFDIQLSSNGTV
ncbi:MAG: hypothetical protein RTU30_16370 [Candidatus Thorarchaeota archaeon]